MGFENVVPTLEEIEQYDLPFRHYIDDSNYPMTLTADRSRAIYMSGVGLTCNPAFGDPDDVLSIYFGSQGFEVILKRREYADLIETEGGVETLKKKRYFPAILSIWSLNNSSYGAPDLYKKYLETPDQHTKELADHSLNEFIQVMKESITVYELDKIYRFNKCQGIVTFGF
ncbi:hypothetical protein NQT62_04980 [Limnobacter humi]|uniref:Uncharacterized protein n=1 Tax=Limnobacter humi TaxID=1778671 RepID=A0ABT1WFG6_9BURK|nr:hypothetical protein [Limnobacter humi]MCQ8895791.1 hypothetical protein [Limnobacter humi]